MGAYAINDLLRTQPVHRDLQGCFGVIGHSLKQVLTDKFREFFVGQMSD
jgi:hypothetical protein